MSGRPALPEELERAKHRDDFTFPDSPFSHFCFLEPAGAGPGAGRRACHGWAGRRPASYGRTSPLNAMEPAAFWNKLGFTGSQIASEIVFNDAVFQALGSAPEKRAYFDAHRVTGVNLSAGLRSTETPFLAFRPSQASGEAESTYTYPLQSTDTTAITATEPYTVGSNGYYRIECVSSFQTEYQQEGARLGSTIAAVSTNYNSNDFITAYSESGFAYEHVGTTQMLSGMTIRLIDPSTDLPVLGMGPNSTVFLEVVKNPQGESKKNEKGKN